MIRLLWIVLCDSLLVVTVGFLMYCGLPHNAVTFYYAPNAEVSR